MLGRPTVVLALVLVVAGLGCTADRFAGPDEPETFLASTSADSSAATIEEHDSASLASLQLVPCPAPDRTTWSSAWIGPEGGVIERGPFTLTIPAGALEDTRLVRLTRPAVDVLVIEASVGNEPHYQFARPVDFAVNVTRYCPDVTDEMLGALRAVWVDAPGGARSVTSLRDRTEGKIKFSTDHFSSYGIAW